MIHLLVNLLVSVVNLLYRDRPLPRFYVLETVARVPYLAYISVLHFYEILGCWHRANWLKVHFTESWNELHHLLILQALGGDRWWFDRVVARTMAVVYYWIIVVVYLISPRAAYHFMELVEKQAYDNYDQFLRRYQSLLKSQPPPTIAVRYYRDGELYMFDELSTDKTTSPYRAIDNLYDVFIQLRNDEAEHIKTMVACQQTRGKSTRTISKSNKLSGV